MEPTINYILIEDRGPLWKKYNGILKKQFPNLTPHKRSSFIESFKDMEDNLYEAIIGGDLDLIISDISLSYETSNKDTFISRLLQNILKRLNSSQKRFLAHKGMGLILVTQFPENNLATIIGEDIKFLNRFFQDWSFLKKADFEEKITKKVNLFTENFTHTSNGWYHNDKLENHFNKPAINEYSFLLENGLTIKINGPNIIALSEQVNHKKEKVRTLHFFDENNQVKVVIHTKEMEAFLDKTNTVPIPDGRDKENQFYEKSTVYFLPIRNRRKVIINATKNWRSRCLNRGRQLILLEKNMSILFNCSFPILNTFIDKHYRRLNHLNLSKKSKKLC